MNLTREQHAILEAHFKQLEIPREERSLLFAQIKSGGNPEAPLMILGDETTGKTMLTGLLKSLGVCVYSPHQCPCVTLHKRVHLSEDDGPYIRGVFEKLGI